MTSLLFAWLALAGPKAVFGVNSHMVLRRFDPTTSFGGAIDGHDQGEVMASLTPAHVAVMKQMGLRPIAYRLRTELGGEVWHWNPAGRWSDGAHKRGYWTSSATADGPILLSYGYRLPRRGNSLDQGDRTDFSRLDDGNPTTFWKSNPYLDPHYTGAPYLESPQWIVIRFAKPERVNELRIAWGKPFATRIRIEYVQSRDDDQWTGVKARSAGSVGGYSRTTFATFTAQAVKVSLLASSETGPAGSTDVRDRLGFAVRELKLGRDEPSGGFRDAIVHRADNRVQTRMYVSSTDPWHRARDRDPNTEQPGFDLLLRRGIDRGQPLLVPTGCLYDTPANVGNEARWLARRHIPLRGIEIGEEPDGNWVDPDAYGRLYLQMARVVRAALPHVLIGGPSFQSVGQDYVAFPRAGEPFLTRLVRLVRQHRRMGEFQFCSFEWYPFDDVWSSPTKLLPTMAGRFSRALARLKRLGMAHMPWLISEFGYSAYAAPAEVDPPGAVFDFDFALAALSHGCTACYQYGYEPGDVIEERRGVFGNNMAILDSTDPIVKLPTFWSAWLLTHRFCAWSGPHQLLRVKGGNDKLGAYACRRPDGSIALALLNRTDVRRRAAVLSSQPRLRGWTYGQPQFVWKPILPDSKPSRNQPPRAVSYSPSNVVLPPYSITVLVLSSGRSRREGEASGRP